MEMRSARVASSISLLCCKFKINCIASSIMEFSFEILIMADSVCALVIRFLIMIMTSLSAGLARLD
jgi:hypothetical protein